MSTPPRVVVIGGVAAGLSAATHALRRRPDAIVTVLERGLELAPTLGLIPAAIADPELSIDDLLSPSPDVAGTDPGLDVRFAHDVIGVDLDAGEAAVVDRTRAADDRVPFDVLILASGSRPGRLTLDGTDLAGVHTICSVADGRRLAQDLNGASPSTVVLGAGPHGVEMAGALAQRGCRVTLVERRDRVLPDWSQASSTEVAAALEAVGVELRLAATATGLEADDHGRVARMAVDDDMVSAELVVLATGIRPDTRLAIDAGLRIGDSSAVWVDQTQGTSHPAVWAAGDCAEAFHRVLRRNVWAPRGATAQIQGRVAGGNAVGGSWRFKGTVATCSLTTAGLEAARTGLSVAEAEAAGFEPVAVSARQRSRSHGLPEGEVVTVTIVADEPSGLLLGAETVGRDGAALRLNPLATALAAHLTVADLQVLDLVAAPRLAPAWDPLLVAANQWIRSREGTP